MNKIASHIAVGGWWRLRRAVEAQVRQAHQDELSKTTDPSQKARIEKTIQQEIQKELKRVASPYSLWGSI